MWNLYTLHTTDLRYTQSVWIKRLFNDSARRESPDNCASCLEMGLCLSKPAEAKYAAPVGKAGLEPAHATPQPSPDASKAPAAAPLAEPTKEEMIGNLMPCAAPPPTELIGNLLDPVTGDIEDKKKKILYFARCEDFVRTSA